MRVIYSGRKTSRTTRLIERCRDLNAKNELCHIVCATHEQRCRVAQRAQELGYKIPLPLTFAEFLTPAYLAANNIKHFLIDNADYLLQELTTVHIDTIVLEKQEGEEL